MPTAMARAIATSAADDGSGTATTSNRLRMDAVSPAVKLNRSWMPILLVTGTALTEGPNDADAVFEPPAGAMTLKGWSCSDATVVPSICAWYKAVGAEVATVAPSVPPSMMLVRTLPLMKLGAANVVGSPTNAEKICVAVVVLVTRMLLSTNGSGSNWSPAIWT